MSGRGRLLVDLPETSALGRVRCAATDEPRRAGDFASELRATAKPERRITPFACCFGRRQIGRRGVSLYSNGVLVLVYYDCRVHSVAKRVSCVGA